MKELKSPPRNAARAGGVAAWSMATALSLALVLGLAPAQALALPQEDAPALEQTSPAGEPGEQDGAAAVESADAPESPEASESPEGSTEDNGAAAAEEPSTPADAAGQGTGEASSPEGVATVLGPLRQALPSRTAATMSLVIFPSRVRSYSRSRRPAPTPSTAADRTPRSRSIPARASRLFSTLMP